MRLKLAEARQKTENNIHHIKDLGFYTKCIERDVKKWYDLI